MDAPVKNWLEPPPSVARDSSPSRPPVPRRREKEKLRFVSADGDLGLRAKRSPRRERVAGRLVGVIVGVRLQEARRAAADRRRDDAERRSRAREEWDRPERDHADL